MTGLHGGGHAAKAQRAIARAGPSKAPVISSWTRAPPYRQINCSIAVEAVLQQSEETRRGAAAEDHDVVLRPMRSLMERIAASCGAGQRCTETCLREMAGPTSMEAERVR